ncbi:hypothetical protein [Clostridium sp.]|uniref:hypothetical protein n=1 Tax=Clostridium sp. TaxID=1506 RepID=UPI002639FB6D|nr:hypothetical protein [Clostridium sp.]
MELNDLKYQSETDDIKFNYKNKEYVICLLRGKYYSGEAGNDKDDNSFDSFEDMADKWIIQGKSLKDVVKDIEVI